MIHTTFATSAAARAAPSWFHRNKSGLLSCLFDWAYIIQHLQSRFIITSESNIPLFDELLLSQLVAAMLLPENASIASMFSNQKPIAWAKAFTLSLCFLFSSQFLCQFQKKRGIERRKPRRWNHLYDPPACEKPSLPWKL